MACCRFMDHIQQKPITTDPCGPKKQHGPCPLIGAQPDLAPQLELHQPSLKGSSESEVSPGQATVASTKVTNQMQSGQTKSGFTPATLASISRPRPTALGSKPAPKLNRITGDRSKQIDLVPVCISGPQSGNILSHSQTETSHHLHSPQSYTSQIYLSPTPSLPPPNLNRPSNLSPNPSLSPQSQRTQSSGSSTQSQTESDVSGEEKNAFRWD